MRNLLFHFSKKPSLRDKVKHSPQSFDYTAQVKQTQLPKVYKRTLPARSRYTRLSQIKFFLLQFLSKREKERRRLVLATTEASEFQNKRPAAKKITRYLTACSRRLAIGGSRYLSGGIQGDGVVVFLVLKVSPDAAVRGFRRPSRSDGTTWEGVSCPGAVSWRLSENVFVSHIRGLFEILPSITYGTAEKGKPIMQLSFQGQRIRGWTDLILGRIYSLISKVMDLSRISCLWKTFIPNL